MKKQGKQYFDVNLNTIFLNITCFRIRKLFDFVSIFWKKSVNYFIFSIV